jgi:hypothetical protein
VIKGRNKTPRNVENTYIAQKACLLRSKQCVCGIKKEDCKEEEENKRR